MVFLPTVKETERALETIVAAHFPAAIGHSRKTDIVSVADRFARDDSRALILTTGGAHGFSVYGVALRKPAVVNSGIIVNVFRDVVTGLEEPCRLRATRSELAQVDARLRNRCAVFHTSKAAEVECSPITLYFKDTASFSHLSRREYAAIPERWRPSVSQRIANAVTLGTCPNEHLGDRRLASSLLECRSDQLHIVVYCTIVDRNDPFVLTIEAFFRESSSALQNAVRANFDRVVERALGLMKWAHERRRPETPKLSFDVFQAKMYPLMICGAKCWSDGSGAGNLIRIEYEIFNPIYKTSVSPTVYLEVPGDQVRASPRYLRPLSTSALQGRVRLAFSTLDAPQSPLLPQLICPP